MEPTACFSPPSPYQRIASSANCMIIVKSSVPSADILSLGNSRSSCSTSGSASETRHSAFASSLLRASWFITPFRLDFSFERFWRAALETQENKQERQKKKRPKQETHIPD